MSYTYNFTKANIKFLDELNKYLKSIEGLPTDFYINLTSQISVVFTEELTQEEYNLLQNSIDSYNPPQQIQIPYKTDIIPITNSVISTTTYSVVGTLLLDGNNITENFSIGSFKIVSMISSGSYMIRVLDLINNNVLTQSISLNNNTAQIIILDNIQNIPENDSLIEIQIIVSDSKSKCNVKLMQINYIEII